MSQVGGLHRVRVVHTLQASTPPSGSEAGPGKGKTQASTPRWGSGLFLCPDKTEVTTTPRYSFRYVHKPTTSPIPKRKRPTVTKKSSNQGTRRGNKTLTLLKPAHNQYFNQKIERTNGEQQERPSTRAHKIVDNGGGANNVARSWPSPALRFNLVNEKMAELDQCCKKLIGVLGAEWSADNFRWSSGWNVLDLYPRFRLARWRRARIHASIGHEEATNHHRCG